jgi:hypothetical protein
MTENGDRYLYRDRGVLAVVGPMGRGRKFEIKNSNLVYFDFVCFTSVLMLGLKDSEIESCQEYKFLGVVFDTSGRDDKKIRSTVI